MMKAHMGPMHPVQPNIGPMIYTAPTDLIPLMTARRLSRILLNDQTISGKSKGIRYRALIMESAKEDTGLLHQLLPPRLEDAGLEECALPPESIKDAFFKAASAVKLRASSVLSADDEDEDATCVKDPWPTAKDASDVVIGIKPESEPEGPCAVDKGSETGADEVKISGDDADEGVRDKVIDGEDGENLGEEGKACVDALKGLDIEGDMKNGDDVDEEEKEKEGKRPTLVEGFV